MSRRWSQRFVCASLEDLARQLRFTPADKRGQQCRRAERLHDELDDNVAYPLDYIAYRITNHRRMARGEAGAELLVGAAARADLRLMIDQLSRSTEMRWEPTEQGRTASQWAERWAVSTKTIGRWRHGGLRWRWMVPPEGGAAQVFILQSAMDHYIQRHEQRVGKASLFSQLPASEKRALIQRARRLAQGRNVSLNQVAAHLSKRCGRALETLRLLLEKHDREHPDEALFGNHVRPLTSRQRKVIARAYRMGVRVEDIAKKYHRTRSTIYRAIHLRRAAQARRKVLTYAASPAFEREDADEVLLRPSLDRLLSRELMPMRWVDVSDLPGPLAPLYHQPMRDDAQQRSLLVRCHYLLFKAARIRDRLDRDAPKARALDDFDACLAQVRRIRWELVRTHLPLVLSVVRRHQVGKTDPALTGLVAGLLEGHQILLASLDKFNPHRSTTFEAYLTYQLMRHFASAQGDASEQGRPLAQRRLSESQMIEQLLKRLSEVGIVRLPADGGGLPGQGLGA